MGGGGKTVLLLGCFFSVRIVERLASSSSSSSSGAEFSVSDEGLERGGRGSLGLEALGGIAALDFLGSCGLGMCSVGGLLGTSVICFLGLPLFFGDEALAIESGSDASMCGLSDSFRSLTVSIAGS